MKRIELHRHAAPDEACRCVELADPGPPGPGEALVRIRAAAINPADLLIFEGRYPGPGELPAPVGIEGAGEVVAVGEGVEDLAPGDRVMSMGRANWAQTLLSPRALLVRLPAELNWRDAAQLKANPPTAELMLSDYAELQPGDWVVQNAANSAVGRHVIRLASARGCKTANIVRRAELIPELEAHGADLVVVDADDVGAEIRRRVGAEARVPLGIDAVGGDGSRKLADSLSDGGVVVNYGFLSGEPCHITPYHTIIHDISLRGFWLVGYMRRTAPAEIAAMYDRVAANFISGVLDSPVEAAYGLDDIAAALAHAARGGRGGKILLTPNGAL